MHSNMVQIHRIINLSRKSTSDLQYEVTNMGQCNFYQLYVLLVVKFIVGTSVHGGKLLFIICTSC